MRRSSPPNGTSVLRGSESSLGRLPVVIKRGGVDQAREAAAREEHRGQHVGVAVDAHAVRGEDRDADEREDGDDELADAFAAPLTSPGLLVRSHPGAPSPGGTAARR